MIKEHRAWAEINLDAIENNMKIIRRATNKEAKVMAVVKADAYGHGAVKVAQTMLSSGADALAVACTDEAVQLRMAGIKVPILILSTACPQDAEALVDYDIASAVFDIDSAANLSEIALKKGKKAKVHIKLDTGMCRIGIDTDSEDCIDKIKHIFKLPGIETEGIFSHLSCADTDKEEFTRKQIERFIHTLEKLESEGIHIPVKHIANSAAIFRYPEAHFDMVRAGIVCYGCYPSEIIGDRGLVPAMSFKARVSRVESLKPGDCVSYGATYEVKKPIVAATLSVGYADGYSRIFSGKTKVIIRGKRLQIIGRICMDQCMTDASDVNNISVGDVATLFGRDGEEFISADELADIFGTINYEILCMVGKRVPRVYLKNGEYISELNYING